MADNIVPITAGSGTSIRTITNAGVDSAAHQQVMTLADSAGNLLGTSAAPIPMQRLDVSATISIAANATSSGLVSGLNGKSVATIHLTGTWTATVQVQLTCDSVNWVNVTGSNVITNATTGAYVASGNMTTTGIYQLDTAGMVAVRVITTAYTSGTVTGVLTASDGTGSVSIDGIPTVALSSGLLGGSNNIGSINIGSTAPSNSFFTSTTTNTATVAKASAGSVHTLIISNTAASLQYVKLYNATSVTLGTTAAVISIPVAASSTVSLPFGPNGFRFSTGICYAVTAGVGATDNTATAAGVLVAMTFV